MPMKYNGPGTEVILDAEWQDLLECLQRVGQKVEDGQEDGDWFYFVAEEEEEAA